ncbi:phospholipase B [Vararia minispora EC-137]|uniref:Phospholipase B n=1 Tax=Vararia minispora EC-137 TaxID=1314806 RepID=A0ACB8QAC2_9AGAM|nr:phospholipase B [Vararia minispora EC-137]
MVHPRRRAVFVSLFAIFARANGVGTAVTDYAPATNQPCPLSSEPLIRVFTPANQSLNAAEDAYVRTRLANVIPAAYTDWVGDGSAIGYNLSNFRGNFSRIGITVSGGGYRAAQYGAGVVAGLDARNDSSKAAGTGGLLQVSSYFIGLSGGSWLTGSLFANDWPTMEELIFGNGADLSGWLLDLDLAIPGGVDVFNVMNQYFYGSIIWSVMAKAAAGIDTSLTDPWARMISYHFLNQTDRNNFFTNSSAHGAGQLWSQILLNPLFQQHMVPFPVIQADSRPVGSNLTTLLSPDSIVYEMTPMEFGSWDPNLSAMMNMTYVGTHLNNGVPPNETACVTGFDQTGFMMGTSASLFNQILDRAHNTLQNFDSSDGNALFYVLQRQLTEVRSRADDVANWPNPFQGIKPTTFEDSSSDYLELIDGSSNGENVPFGQLFVKARALDVIVCADGSADDNNNWPNGTSPLASQDRIKKLLQSSHQQFPPIPGNEAQFISTGVRQRPTFFGCDPQQSPAEYPLVVYLPNSPPFNGKDPVSNTGTFQIQYDLLHTRQFIDQVHANVLAGFKPNTTEADPSFGKCLQCAALDRARRTVNITRSTFCQTCFDQYCFDPNNPPSASELPGRRLVLVNPSPGRLAQLSSFFSREKVPIILGFIGAALFIAGLTLFLVWRKRRLQRQQMYDPYDNNGASIASERRNTGPGHEQM